VQHFLQGYKVWFWFLFGGISFAFVFGFHKILISFFSFLFGLFSSLCLKGDLSVAKELGFRVSVGNRLGVGT
jgi:hypothetical protein